MTPAGLAVAGFACFFAGMGALIVHVEADHGRRADVAGWVAGFLWVSSVALLLAGFAWEVLK